MDKPTCGILDWLPPPKHQTQKIDKTRDVYKSQETGKNEVETKKEERVQNQTMFVSAVSMYNLVGQMNEGQSPPLTLETNHVPVPTQVSEAAGDDPLARLFMNNFQKDTVKMYSVSHEEVLKSTKDSKLMPQPTVINKRRHHISELVENAFILENEIKAAASHRNNSKRQSAMRYGW